MGFGSKMKQLRKDAGLNQQEVAEKLGMARATYASLEVDRRDPDLAELRALAQFYEIPLARLIVPDEELLDTVNEPPADYKTPRKTKPTVAASPDKLRQILLYIAEKVGAKPNVGEAVLHKLLYFIDADAQQQYGHSITNLTYVHSRFGPTPTRTFSDLVRQMEADGELEVISTKHFNNTQKKYLPIKKADLSELSAQELESINDTLARLSSKTSAELTELAQK